MVRSHVQAPKFATVQIDDWIYGRYMMIRSSQLVVICWFNSAANIPISRLTSGEVRGLSIHLGESDSRTRYHTIRGANFDGEVLPLKQREPISSMGPPTNQSALPCYYIIYKTGGLFITP